MKIGFTGTSRGMSDEQKSTFLKVIRMFRHQHEFIEFHHGDCRGADEDAQEIINKYQLVDQIDIHPPRDG